MEGIFGILSFRAPLAHNLLNNMARTTSPWPEVSYVSDGRFGLGMRRLVLVKKTQVGNPTWSIDGRLCIAINGEVDNYAELRHQLERQGYEFSSDSDAELIANLYLDRGEKFLKELNSLLVVAIWDSKEQEIILAQDRFGGIRQFYYTLLPDMFIFASGIRPILASGEISSEVDEDSLIDFFCIGRVLPPDTLFKGIKKLMPGYVLRCQKGLVSTKRVDGFNFATELEKSEVPLLEDYYTKAIQRSLVTDSSVGLLLSGGFDSSLNTAMASGLTDKPLKTFSIGFADKSLDELSYARLVSNQFNTEHHELLLGSSDALEILPQLVWCNEEPLSDPSSVPSYHVAHFAKLSVDAIIAGDGPDHLWGRQYQLLARQQFFHALPANRILKKLLVKNLDRGFSQNRFIRFAQKLAQAADEPIGKIYKDRIIWLLWNTSHTKRATAAFSEQLLSKYHQEIDLTQLSPCEATDDFNLLIAYDLIIDGSFGVFSKFGKAAAGQSLLVREPYLDRSLVDFINQLPRPLKVRGHLWRRLRGRAEEKYLLRQALGRQLLPRAILSRHKGGFTPPLGEWLREYLQKLSPQGFLSSSIKQAGYFNVTTVEQLIQDHAYNGKDNTEILYMLLSFIVWHMLYIESLAIECPTLTLSELIHK